jgi:hypothetical protein
VAADIGAVDAFDLPEWLGTTEVTWTAGSSVHGGHHVVGELCGELPDGRQRLGCDLLAGDQAYPVPVLPDTWRTQVHQAWTYGQVLLLRYDGRLTVTVPGTEFTADRVLEVVARLAKAVGVAPERFVAALRL